MPSKLSDSGIRATQDETKGTDSKWCKRGYVMEDVAVWVWFLLPLIGKEQTRLFHIDLDPLST